MNRRSGSAALVSMCLLVASTASAQVQLTGTYVRYVAVGSNGTMICTTGACIGGHSMQYGETVAGLPSCDLYYPGSPQESFTVEATPMGGTEVTLTNSGTAAGAFTTISGPTLTGRTITWSGRATSGTAVIRIDQTFELQMDERFVRLAVTITNEGTVALSNVYYLRNGDPDHGECSIGADFATGNDVRRQPPIDDGALATSLGGTAPNQLVVGLGAHDPRARAYTGGFSNTDASAEWTTPVDSGGALLDEAVDLVFKELSLSPGASTIFEMFYVWGPDVATVETRFDELGFPTAPCVGLAEGAACTTSGGDSGLCRATRCCTGCFDGSRCRSGSSPMACGGAGVSCASCADADACTSDVCVAGACTNPSAPSGTTCDDGMFCTATDRCDGSGGCLGTGVRCNDGQSCTVDTCDESLDACMFTPTAGCIIGGACVGDGISNITNPCQVCDPARDPSDWSPRPVGTVCGSPLCASGSLRGAECDATGTCQRTTMRCPTGRCLDTASCEAACTADSCASDEWCNETSGTCETQGDLGDACTDSAGCTSGSCADGVCCDGACDGTCERCDTSGACDPISRGMDPDDECAMACDGAGACEAPDAGPPADAGAPRDAGASADAAVASDGGGFDAGPGVDDGGCGCRAASPRDRSAPFWLVLLGLFAYRLRRSSARRPR